MINTSKELIGMENDMDLVLRQELENFMERNEINQSEVARDLGITRAAVSTLLNDKARYKVPDMLLRLADYLGYEIRLVREGELQ